MTGSDHRKQSVYLPGDLVEWVKREGRRQDRSMSWLVQQALRIARPMLEEFPEAPPAEWPDRGRR